jgi:hypothetical protein
LRLVKIEFDYVKFDRSIKSKKSIDIKIYQKVRGEIFKQTGREVVNKVRALK